MKTYRVIICKQVQAENPYHAIEKSRRDENCESIEIEVKDVDATDRD